MTGQEVMALTGNTFPNISEIFTAKAAQARECCMGREAGPGPLFQALSGPFPGIVFWRTSELPPSQLYIISIMAALMPGERDQPFSEHLAWWWWSKSEVNTLVCSEGVTVKGQSLHLGIFPLVTMSLICIVEKLTCRWCLAHLIRELSCATALWDVQWGQEVFLDIRQGEGTLITEMWWEEVGKYLSDGVFKQRLTKLGDRGANCLS